MKNVPKKIKVCHFADHLTCKADGIFTHILSIIKNTNGEIFEHYVFCNESETVEKKITEAGVHIIISKKINKKLPVCSTLEFLKLCIKENISIVHAHYLKPYIISSFLKLFLGYKVIYNYHGLFIKNEYYNRLEERLYQLAHLIVCKSRLINFAIAPSHKSKEILLRETKLFPAVEVYYNGTNISLENRKESSSKLLNIPDSNILIGIIARIYPPKRIDIALNILKLLLPKHENIHFVICGDGISLMQMRKYSYELGVDKNSTFLGYVKDVKSVISEFDIILLTSDYEGFPLTIWEAMAAAVPIVSTDVGGIKEIVEKENCGILFEKGNVNDGAACLLKLIEDKKLRKELGKNGQRAIKNKYNNISFGKRMEEIYQSVLTND